MLSHIATKYYVIDGNPVVQLCVHDGNDSSSSKLYEIIVSYQGKTEELEKDKSIMAH